MGYLTIRNIHIDTGKHTPRDISLAFTNRFDSFLLGLYTYVSKSTSKNGVLDFDGTDYRTWYREIEDMLEFTKQFPDATITINGTGEEPNDVWVRRYHKGHCHAKRQISSLSDWESVR